MVFSKRCMVALLTAVLTISAGCDREVSTKEQNPTADTRPAKPVMTQFSPEKALEIIYGNYNAGEKRSEWRPSKEQAEQFAFESEYDLLYTKVLLSEPFTQNGTENYILITETIPPNHDCHVCAPSIGAALFTKVGGNWQPKIEQKFVRLLGALGVAPDAKLIKIGPDRHVILFYPGYTSQGITLGAMSIIADVDSKFKEILFVEEIEGNNAGACGDDLGPCWEYSSEVEYVKGRDPLYFDIKITLSGTKENEGKIVPYKEVKTYTFSGGEYKLEQRDGQ